MLYRITADLIFPSDAHAQAVWAVIVAQFAHTITLNPDTPLQERSFAERHVCTHDTDPAIPCVPTDTLISPVP